MNEEMGNSNFENMEIKGIKEAFIVFQDGHKEKLNPLPQIVEFDTLKIEVDKYELLYDNFLYGIKNSKE